jgi:uncharacterized RmlC-like cupin family protein
MDDFAKKILSDVNLDEIRPRAKERSPADHWPPAVLLERAAYLRKMARYGDGSASETIREYPHYAAELSFRSRTSDAVVHEGYSCMIHVLAGAATLAIGGTVTRARSAGAGEIRGILLENGVPQELRQGDIAHVPAGVPHQFLIGGDKSVTCLIVKIQEVN